MLPRPKPQETEEDLLKFQDKFLNDPSSCGATGVIVRTDKRKAEDERSVKEPHSMLEQTEQMQVEQNGNSNGDHTTKKVKFKRDEETRKNNATPALFEDVVPEEIVLQDIVERDVTSWKVLPPSAPKGHSFPQVYRRDKKVPSASSKQSISIFAQQMQNSREKNLREGSICRTVEVDSKPTSNDHPAQKRATNKVAAAHAPILSSVDLTAILGETSVMVDGTGLQIGKDKESVVKEIHEENLSRLANMSQGEILKEQEQLMGILDPDIIRYLKTKRNKVTSAGKLTTVESGPEHATAKVNPITEMELDETELKEISVCDIPNLEGRSSPSTNFNTTRTQLQGSNKISPLADAETDESGGSDAKITVDAEMPFSLPEIKNWLHMGKLEGEKLEWMSDLPKPEPIDPKSGYPARFDFDGNLIMRDANIPTHRGLHHHGEEPEVPGYTLEELFLYGRSAVIQQRVLALNTLAKILSKSQEGWYDKCLSEPLLPRLLDAGLVLLLRWALDDNNDGSLVAAVSALHALIVCIPDEICLERVSLWFRGEEVPLLKPEVIDGGEKQDFGKGKGDAKEDELTDAELVKLDVIKGLIRMDVLPRLRYLLEVGHPPATVVVQILEILIRIASHSLDSAFAITRCSRLLQVIVTEFLPTAWSATAEEQCVQGKLTSVYGIPVPQAVKLIRSLASAGRNIAEDLLRCYDITSSLLCYASIDPAEGCLPTKEALALCLASYSTWKTFLHYGLMVQSYLDFYPLIMRQLLYYQTLSVSVDVVKNEYNFDHATSLLQLLTTTLKLTAVKSSFELQSGPLVEWTQVEGLFVAADLCLKKWLWELARTEEVTHSALNLVGTALYFVTEFYYCSTKQPTYKPTETLDKIEKLYTSCLIPFIESRVFENLLSRIRQFSSLLCRTPTGKKRDPSTLPSLGSILWGGQLNPVLEELSPFAFLTHLIRSLLVCNRLHAGLSSNIHPSLFDNPNVIAFLRQLAVSPASMETTGNWFLRFETHFVYYLLALGALKKCNYPRVYHEAAMQLLPRLQRGDDEIAHQLMSMVIFNANFISEFDDIAVAMEELKLKASSSLAAPTLEKVEVSTLKLLHRTCLCLPSICSTYKSYLEKYASLQKITRWKKPDSLSVPHISVRPVPADFFYLPIMVLRQMTTSRNASTSTVAADLNVETASIHCLQWCQLLECWRKDIIGTTVVSKRFCYLATVFLMSSDLFLHSEIRGYLEGCLRKLAEHKELTKMKWGKNPIPGVTSFYELYVQLLEQFEATSYGDHLFGEFILIPLQRHHDVQLRRAIWTEHCNAARILGVGVKELLVPLQNFLIPTEEDSEMLICYFKALINGYIRHAWCPVLYVIAVHHLHHFLFDDSMKALHASLRHKMLHKLVVEHKNQVISAHLLGYLEPNSDAELGFNYAAEPLETVQTVIKQVESECR